MGTVSPTHIKSIICILCEIDCMPVQTYNFFDSYIVDVLQMSSAHTHGHVICYYTVSKLFAEGMRPARQIPTMLAAEKLFRFMGYVQVCCLLQRNRWICIYSVYTGYSTKTFNIQVTVFLFESNLTVIR